MAKGFQIPQKGIDTYVFRRREDIGVLRLAIEQRQTDPFFRIGHCLQGNAAPFGFEELESLGLNLERICESKDWNTAKELVDQFETWALQQIKIRGLSKDSIFTSNDGREGTVGVCAVQAAGFGSMKNIKL